MESPKRGYVDKSRGSVDSEGGFGWVDGCGRDVGFGFVQPQVAGVGREPGSDRAGGDLVGGGVAGQFGRAIRVDDDRQRHPLPRSARGHRPQVFQQPDRVPRGELLPAQAVTVEEPPQVTKVVGVGDQRVGRAIPGRQEPQEPRDDLDRLTALIEQIDPVGAFLAALLPYPHRHLRIRPARSPYNWSHPGTSGASGTRGVHVTTTPWVSVACSVTGRSLALPRNSSSAKWASLAVGTMIFVPWVDHWSDTWV